MSQEIYLSLEKQEDYEHSFSYALVYRGGTQSETACAINVCITQKGKYELSLIDHKGDRLPSHYTPQLTKKDATGLAKKILHIKAEELRHFWKIEKGLVDTTQ